MRSVATLTLRRFFIHKIISAFADDIVLKYGEAEQQAMLFPSSRAALRCADFIWSHSMTQYQHDPTRTIDLKLDESKAESESLKKVSPSISAVFFPKALFPIAKQYWQHSGDGVSSRRAEFCHGLFVDELLSEVQPNYEKRLRGVDDALRKLKGLIEGIKAREPLPVSTNLSGCILCAFINRFSGP